MVHPFIEMISPEELEELEEQLNEDMFGLVSEKVEAQRICLAGILEIISGHAPHVHSDADGVYTVSMRHAWADILKGYHDEALKGVELMRERDEVRAEIAQRRLPTIRFVD